MHWYLISINSINFATRRIRLKPMSFQLHISGVLHTGKLVTNMYVWVMFKEEDEFATTSDSFLNQNN